MSSFGIYIVGFIIVIVGLALAANMLGVPSVWIGIGIIILVGIAILTGVNRTKRPDPPTGGTP
jgi:membrane-bound acyltransferase YfiQ involved in biofilm formation